MALEVGSIVEGTVSGITKFGAFINLGDRKVGLVHISEVAAEYVNDVNDYLKMRDKVRVKVISIDDKGKIALSIKQVDASEAEGKKSEHFHKNHGGESHFHHRGEGERNETREVRHTNERRDFHSQPRAQAAPVSFEDKLSRFLKDSDERLLDLKRNTESKRGGRGARRGD